MCKYGREDETMCSNSIVVEGKDTAIFGGLIVLETVDVH